MAQGATLANYHAVYHPSDENYLAIAGGDTYARGAVYWPVIKDPHPNLGDELEARSMTWKAYEQGMGYRCNDRASTEFTPLRPLLDRPDHRGGPGRRAVHRERRVRHPVRRRVHRAGPVTPAPPG
jgi:hypothetical protein